MITRRSFVCSAASAFAATAIPAIPAASATVESASPLTLAWAVGTPGEYDWQDIFASDKATAIKIWSEEKFGACDCAEVQSNPEDPDPEYVCDRCSADVDALRIEAWDKKKTIVGADWINAGMGSFCDRCSYETQPDTGWVVGGDVVCEDCMTLADFDIVAPERAAEMRADAEETP